MGGKKVGEEKGLEKDGGEKGIVVIAGKRNYIPTERRKREKIF